MLCEKNSNEIIFYCEIQAWTLVKLTGPRQANLVLIPYASSEGSGEPAHARSLARTFAARSYKQWIKRNLQTENQIPGPSEWLGMHRWNLSWRNAWRRKLAISTKFAWRGPYSYCCIHGDIQIDEDSIQFSNSPQNTRLCGIALPRQFKWMPIVYVFVEN